MTDLEDRIKRRLLMEHPELVHENDPFHEPWEWDLEQDLNRDWFEPFAMARVAALEAEDSFNPIAATAVVRKNGLDTAGPDLDAFAAAFATALTRHDEEYL